jgi:hypothetical protein
MKKILLTLLFALSINILLAQTNPRTTTVRGYTKKSGTHVNTYRKTSPNHTQRDNYSTKGNTNPYTYKRGYKKPKK